MQIELNQRAEQTIRQFMAKCDYRSVDDVIVAVVDELTHRLDHPVATSRGRLLTVERLPDPPYEDVSVGPPCELPHPPGKQVFARPGLERLPDPIAPEA